MIPGGIGLAEVTITVFYSIMALSPAIAIGTALLWRLGSFCTAWY
jgi:uncharacterized membrane protein YbhN (UPF0104 family)